MTFKEIYQCTTTAGINCVYAAYNHYDAMEQHIKHLRKKILDFMNIPNTIVKNTNDGSSKEFTTNLKSSEV